MTPPFSDLSFTLAPIAMGLYGLLLIFLGLRALYAIIPTYIRWGENEIHDVTHLNIPLPDGAAPIVNELELLGFRPLGIERVRLFNVRHFLNNWVYLHESRQIYASLVVYKQGQHKILIGLASWFPDEAYIETMYPVGENISESNYQSHFAHHDIESAYRHQQQQIENWRDIHGNPVIFNSLAEINRWDPVYYRRYAVRRTRRITIIALISMVVMLFCGSALIASAFTLQQDVSLPTPQLTTSPLIIFALIVIPIITAFAVNNMVWNPPEAIDARKPKP